MKKTFTIEEVRSFLDKALAESKLDENAGDEIACAMNKAWNRGVNSMFNFTLIEMYDDALKEEENNVANA